MKKKLVAILSAIVMLTSVFLFTGCDKTNNSATGNNENQGGGKPIDSTSMWVKNSGMNEFNAEEDVTIDLCFGTFIPKERIIGGSYSVDIFAWCYSNPRAHGWDLMGRKPDAEAFILRVEEFYKENYPLFLTENGNIKAPDYNMTLPNALFVGEDGIIIIQMNHLGGRLHAELCYKVEDEKIILGEYIDIYNTDDSQLRTP